MRIAIDAMGGDAGASLVVDGALVAARHLQVGLLLAGDPAIITAELRRHPAARGLDVQIADAPDRVEMAESAGHALRRKPRASIRVAAEAVRDGKAHAVFSAGHTGASVMACHAAFGMLPAVDRPALATIIPTRRNPAVLLDAGATVGCRPPHLVQFAVMGAAYAQVALGLPAPRVALLSVGEEETKGNDLTREAHRLLKEAPVNFIGNVEGRHVYAGDADVIVCDGFTGNVTLKLSEGLVETVESLLHDELAATFGGRVGYVLSRQAFRRFRRRVDYSEYGGAPLLGLNGLCIVGHGRSSAKAVANAVTMAVRAVEEKLLERLRAGVSALSATSASPSSTLHSPSSTLHPPSSR
ncbi:MAG TPA: phosphate acyltransferase PlsX [Vicinamibacterales bacterium]|nr:phosphate acyltransferase PlsX [Vicinamibacterales bacterium]